MRISGILEAGVVMLFDVGRDPVKEASVLDGRGVKGVKVSVEVS